MQSGFGLLEAGAVKSKNEVNIMVKNAVDVVFGGITYWMYGYGLSFGTDPGNNAFCGVGSFLVDASTLEMGNTFSTYIFQLSFATTATTIVSGAMAERTQLSSYIVFSLLNTITYAIPAHWIWGEKGFLYELGVLDIAGSGGVHLLGGVSAVVAAMLLGPRKGRYDKGWDTPWELGNATNSMIGMFMLWWGWLGFNCGSTFGISGGKWKLAAKSAVTTINGSVGGGLAGIVLSYFLHKGVYDIGDIVNSVLGGLVGITAGCALVRPWEAFIIGLIGGIIGVLGVPLFNWFKIDDPVGAIAVHGLAGFWGMLSLGFFCDVDPVIDASGGQAGLFHGGGFRLLGVQTLACVCVIAWSAATSFIMLKSIDMVMGLRMSEEHERLGADFVEHGLGQNSDLVILQEAVTTKTAENRRKSMGGGRKLSVSFRSPSRHGAFSFQRTVTMEIDPDVDEEEPATLFEKVPPSYTRPGLLTVDNNHARDNPNYVPDPHEDNVSNSVRF
ncbi:putative ammonium transporter 3 [Tubulanus polymorphus]|uniref:putative ammonium transporter 3 n=1 Tax=Tubulanus polymorphus TaxID=672921 RepID=UPI003DA24844